MPLTIEDIPESLWRWWNLNDEYERRENDIFPSSETAADPTPEQRAAYDHIQKIYGPMIEKAWDDAPVRDRWKVDWRMLKKAWQERNDHLEPKGHG